MRGVPSRNRMRSISSSACLISSMDSSYSCRPASCSPSCRTSRHGGSTADGSQLFRQSLIQHNHLFVSAHEDSPCLVELHPEFN